MSAETPRPPRDLRLAVEVLLREYDTLRTEILARVRNRFELLGFLAVVATVVASSDIDSNARVWVAGLAAATALTVWAWFAGGIKRCAKRILVIEERVNSLMEDDSLLAWETMQPRGSWWRRLIR